jgi:cobalt-zinc-cadmium efflux system protein
MGVEFAAGWYANSLALLSDAAHMLTDAGSLLFSLFVVWLALRPASSRMSYGWHRAEILGALASGLAIWAIAGVLIYEAVQRLSDPPEVHGPVVLIVSSIGLAANLVSMRFLHGEKDHSLNVRAAYLHLIADAMGSVGALIAGAVLWYTGWRPIDPIITLLFSGLMLYSSWDLIKESVLVLMEHVPLHLDPDQIRADIRAVEGVEELHDLHVWTVGGGNYALSVHLISRAGDPGVVLARVNDLVEERFGIRHTTIPGEHPDRFRSERCFDCAAGKAGVH